MIRRTRLGILLAAALVTLAGVAVSTRVEAQGKKIVRIGHREKSSKGMKGRNFTPLLNHLNANPLFQYQIEAVEAADDLYDRFKAKQFDIAFLGPVYYVRAHHEFKAVAILAEGESYRSVIITKTDSRIKKVDDLRGRSFAFGYPESTSSHFFPLLMLSKARIKEADLGPHEFVGSHSNVVDAVLTGKFEAGGVIKGEYERRKGQGLRVVVESDPIPGVPLVVHRDADPALVKEFREAMLSFRLKDAGPNDAFAAGAVLVEDKDYNQIRFLSKVLLGKDYS